MDYLRENAQHVIESADDVIKIMLRCIAVLCLCVNKNDKKVFFYWRQYKNNIKPRLQRLQKVFYLGPCWNST